MKKPIRITESDLQRMVKNSVRRALKEEAVDEGLKDWGRTAALGAGFGAAAAGAVGTDNPISRGLDRQFADQEEVGRAFPEDRAEFGDELGPQKPLSPDTISWEKANGIGEGRINRAITESIRRFINELSTDTIDSAREKAEEKFKKISGKNGALSPMGQHAKSQAEKFRKAYADEYQKGNTARKARLDKNSEDRQNGKRTYVKGKGWRTQQEEQ
jgi:hypothetical protein